MFQNASLKFFFLETGGEANMVPEDDDTEAIRVEGLGFHAEHVLKHSSADML